MWLERFTFIKDRYYNLCQSESEVISQLNDLVNKENIDIIWREFSERFKKVVHQYSLGATSESFSEKRWNNMWRVLIAEGFQFQELITNNKSTLTIRFPANHRFIVHTNFIARLKLIPNEPFPDEFDIRIYKGTLLAPVCDFMVSDEKLNCIPWNYEQFRDQNIPKVYLTKELFDNYYLIIKVPNILKYCWAKFEKVNINSS
jgi:hypothetical protein